ncbi:MAG: hypothetical protein WDN67_00830 [Candidatus Moraniibacteriota bacterium]
MKFNSANYLEKASRDLAYIHSLKVAAPEPNSTELRRIRWLAGDVIDSDIAFLHDYEVPAEAINVIAENLLDRFLVFRQDRFEDLRAALLTAYGADVPSQTIRHRLSAWSRFLKCEEPAKSDADQSLTILPELPPVKLPKAVRPGGKRARKAAETGDVKDRRRPRARKPASDQELLAAE